MRSGAKRDGHTPIRRFRLAYATAHCYSILAVAQQQLSFKPANTYHALGRKRLRHILHQVRTSIHQVHTLSFAFAPFVVIP